MVDRGRVAGKGREPDREGLPSGPAAPLGHSATSKREAKWPPIGRAPCVRCGHLYGYHARSAGPCATEGCDCKAFLHRGLGDGTLVVTPEQLQDGYRRNPSVPLGGKYIQSERADYVVIARYEDGNYLVREPK